jgi:ribosomal protein L11 methyltransferase
LKPAFAFGFGEHPTTRLIATWLELWCRARAGASVLDVGCGTGVLALVAARSGAGRVVGVDSSRPAIDAARSNASLNGLEAGVTFSEQGADALAGEFDCVVANIEANVLEAACSAIAGALAPLGELALAGFIEEQEAALITRYGAAGVALARVAQEGDWCLLAGRRAGARVPGTR